MIWEIHTLADDEVITKPGFYQMSLERHHNQPCDGVSVTSGVLRRMHKHGPSKVWATHELNPNRYQPKRSDALRTGAIMAAFVEGGLAEVNKSFQTVPEDAPFRPTKQQLRALKEGRESKSARTSIAFWSEIDRDGREIVKEAELELMAQMALVLSADPASSAALGGLPEITMAAFDEQTQLWFLSRPDNMKFDGTMTDYKKVNTSGRAFDQHFCDSRVNEHGYDSQMGFAVDVFHRITDVWSPQAGLIFQEDEPPHDVIPMPIEEEDLKMGIFHNKQAAIRFRECFDANHWPGPGVVMRPYRRSDAARERILEEMKMAGEAP